MSGNHNQSLERALDILEAAAKTGAHGLKLQTYTTDTMTLDLKAGEFFIDDPQSLWHGHSLYELYEKAHTPWEWHKPILDKCKELGIIGFSTPFDVTAVDFLESLEVPCYKIASFENTDLPLIRKVASTGKPMIISTGMATVAELDETVRTAREAGCSDLILLKCTSTYPATPENTNLLTIPHLRELFDLQVGLSDHTLGIGVSVASVALGATFIEKHFTLSRADGGVDSAFSMEPEEMAQLVVETERAWQGLGTISYGATIALGHRNKKGDKLMTIEMTCPTCGSHDISKNGTSHRGKQNYKCRDCGRQFVEDPQWRPKPKETKDLVNRLLHEKIPLAGIARATELSESWVQAQANAIYEAVSKTPEVLPKPQGPLRVQMDELWSLHPEEAGRARQSYYFLCPKMHYRGQAS